MSWLIFNFFKADDGEPCFVVSGSEGLVRPVFLARLNAVEVGVDTFPIGSVPHCDGSALFCLEGTGDCVGILVLNDFNGSSELSVGDRVLVGGCG